MAAPERNGPGAAGKPDRPGVIAPPPLIFAGFFIAGWLIDTVAPGAAFAGPAWTVIGAALIVAGALLGLWVIFLFRRARTAIEPWKPTTALVTDGPFRFSRNPVYVALALCHAGLAMLLHAPWALVLLAGAILVIDIGVIRREERYLAAKFGERYLAWCRTVRRWL